MFEHKAKELVEALKSGQYNQGIDALADLDDYYCCMGVACDISDVEAEWIQSDFPKNTYMFEGNYATLPYKVMEEFGFYNEFGSRRDGAPIEINKKSYSSLTEANDDGCKFYQIANYIAKHWEML